MRELRKPDCHDFGPTFVGEHLHRTVGVKIGWDTVRKWMIKAGLWQAHSRSIATVHQWRAATQLLWVFLVRVEALFVKHTLCRRRFVISVSFTDSTSLAGEPDK